MKTIIAGSRSFNNFKLLTEICDKEIITEIISGTARGADTLGEYYAVTHNILIKRFPANWNKYGKSAGYIRNKKMAEYADALIAFWDGKSKGTKHMIDLATNQGLKIKVIMYEK